MPPRCCLLVAIALLGAAPAVAQGAARSKNPALAIAGDALRGAAIYEASCGGCHALDANRIGPAHRGVVGRKAGAAKGFAYSPALLKSRIVWTPERLDAWLAGPRQLVPGARMAFQLGDPQQRADVIAYLAAEGAKPAT
jgi:cytochrome c